MEENKEFELDLFDILRGLREGKWLIIVLTIIFALILGCRTFFLTEDTYTSTGTLYVSNTNTNLHNNIIEGADLDASRSLGETYTEILKSYSFLNEVGDLSGYHLNYDAMKGLVDISQIEETELINISVTTNSADKSYQIVKTIIERAPAKLTSIYEGGMVKTLDEAIRPNGPNGRGTVKSVFLGAVLGFALAVVILVVKRIFDRRIRTVADIEKRYEISILGELPL